MWVADSPGRGRHPSAHGVSSTGSTAWRGSGRTSSRAASPGRELHNSSPSTSTGGSSSDLRSRRERYRALRRLQKVSRHAVQISDPFDVNTENTANYAAWENLAGAIECAPWSGCVRWTYRTGEAEGARKVNGWSRLRPRARDARRRQGRHRAKSSSAHPYCKATCPSWRWPVTCAASDPQGWITPFVSGRGTTSKRSMRVNRTVKQTQWYADYVARHFADLNTVVNHCHKPGTEGRNKQRTESVHELWLIRAHAASGMKGRQRCRSPCILDRMSNAGGVIAR